MRSLFLFLVAAALMMHNCRFRAHLLLAWSARFLVRTKFFFKASHSLQSSLYQHLQHLHERLLAGEALLASWQERHSCRKDQPSCRGLSGQRVAGRKSPP